MRSAPIIDPMSSEQPLEQPQRVEEAAAVGPASGAAPPKEEASGAAPPKEDRLVLAPRQRNTAAGAGVVVAVTAHDHDNRVRGLQNLGNTCFFNSTVQCLASLELISRHFVSSPARPDEGNLTSAFRNFCVSHLSPEGGKAWSPAELLSAITRKAKRFQGRAQQDAQELLRVLLDVIDEEEKVRIKVVYTAALAIKAGREEKPPAGEAAAPVASPAALQLPPSIIARTFGGKLLSVITCLTCGNSSVTRDPCFDLSLPIPGGAPGGATLRKPRGGAPEAPDPSSPLLYARGSPSTLSGGKVKGKGPGGGAAAHIKELRAKKLAAAAGGTAAASAAADIDIRVSGGSRRPGAGAAAVAAALVPAGKRKGGAPGTGDSSAAELARLVRELGVKVPSMVASGKKVGQADAPSSKPAKAAAAAPKATAGSSVASAPGIDSPSEPSPSPLGEGTAAVAAGGFVPPVVEPPSHPEAQHTSTTAAAAAEPEQESLISPSQPTVDSATAPAASPPHGAADGPLLLLDVSLLPDPEWVETAPRNALVDWLQQHVPPSVLAPLLMPAKGKNSSKGGGGGIRKDVPSKRLQELIRKLVDDAVVAGVVADAVDGVQRGDGGAVAVGVSEGGAVAVVSSAPLAEETEGLVSGAPVAEEAEELVSSPPMAEEALSPPAADAVDGLPTLAPPSPYADGCEGDPAAPPACPPDHVVGTNSSPTTVEQPTAITPATSPAPAPSSAADPAARNTFGNSIIDRSAPRVSSGTRRGNNTNTAQAAAGYILPAWTADLAAAVAAAAASHPAAALTILDCLAAFSAPEELSVAAGNGYRCEKCAAIAAAAACAIARPCAAGGDSAAAGAAGAAVCFSPAPEGAPRVPAGEDSTASPLRCESAATTAPLLPTSHMHASSMSQLLPRASSTTSTSSPASPVLSTASAAEEEDPAAAAAGLGGWCNGASSNAAPRDASAPAASTPADSVLGKGAGAPAPAAPAVDPAAAGGAAVEAVSAALEGCCLASEPTAAVLNTGAVVGAAAPEGDLVPAPEEAAQAATDQQLLLHAYSETPAPNSGCAAPEGTSGVVAGPDDGTPEAGPPHVEAPRASTPSPPAAAPAPAPTPAAPLRDATKRILLGPEPPPVLTLQLKRFAASGGGGRMGSHFAKISKPVSFPEVLDVAPFSAQRAGGDGVVVSSAEREPLLYRLCGIVVHSGGLSSGHYIAYVRHGERAAFYGPSGRRLTPPCGGRWSMASDTLVSEVELREVLQAEAYVLFYERVAVE